MAMFPTSPLDIKVAILKVTYGDWLFAAKSWKRLVLIKYHLMQHLDGR